MPLFCCDVSSQVKKFFLFLHIPLAKDSSMVAQAENPILKESVQHEKMKIEIHAERKELEKKRKASYDHLQQLSTVTPAQKKPSFKRNSFMPSST